MLKRRNSLGQFDASDLISNPITKIQGGVASEMLRRGLSARGNQRQPIKKQTMQTTSQSGRQLESKPSEGKTGN